jgi:hypothetical protein
LDEFSPVGRLFTLGDFFLNYRSGANYWATFIHGESHGLIFTKMGWTTLWAIIPSTHQVTLLVMQLVISPRCSSKPALLL